MRISATLCAISLLLLAACGSKSAPAQNPPPPLADDSQAQATQVSDQPAGQPQAGSVADTEALVQRTIVLFDSLADGVQAAGGDCDQMASAITGWVDTNKGEIQALQEASEQVPDEHADQINPALLEQLQATQNRLGMALTPCMDSPAVEQALERLEAAGEE